MAGKITDNGSPEAIIHAEQESCKAAKRLHRAERQRLKRKKWQSVKYQDRRGAVHLAASRNNESRRHGSFESLGDGFLARLARVRPGCLCFNTSRRVRFAIAGRAA